MTVSGPLIVPTEVKRDLFDKVKYKENLLPDYKCIEGRTDGCTYVQAAVEKTKIYQVKLLYRLNYTATFG